MIGSLVDKKEIMKLLNISKGKLDSMIRNKTIHYYKTDRVIRFDKNKVLESLEDE
jgi:excisionase family DNA binding protein